MDSHQREADGSPIVEQLAALEREVRSLNEVILRLVESIGGVAANQLQMAANQQSIIEELIRIAEAGRVVRDSDHPALGT